MTQLTACFFTQWISRQNQRELQWTMRHRCTSAVVAVHVKQDVGGSIEVVCGVGGMGGSGVVT